uniref:RNA polymerase beta subunit n=1 Tax=Cephaleuros diffusus TaxID=1519597 RepID=UPI0030018EEA
MGKNKESYESILSNEFLAQNRFIYSPLTYSSEFLIPVQINDQLGKKMYLRWLLLVDLLIQTKRGHFIVNGYPKTVIHQIVRRAWMGIKIQYFKNTNSIPLPSLLEEIKGSSNKENKILRTSENNEYLRELSLKVKTFPNIRNAHKFYIGFSNFKRLKTNYESYPLNLMKSFPALITNFVPIPTLNQNLTKERMILRKSLLGESIQSTSLDHLNQRHIRTSGEFLFLQFWRGVLRFYQIIKQLSYLKIFNSIFKEFFNLDPLSQDLDETNGLSEIIHKRRISALGNGGVNTKNAPLSIRSIHPSFYGRLCPIDSPEGDRVGLINSLTSYAKITSIGYIATPFYKTRLTNTTFITSQPVDSFHKSYLSFIPSQTSPINWRGPRSCYSIVNSQFLARQDSKFLICYFDFISFQGYAPITILQFFSPGVGLIPFLEHDDGTRALMGANMQRQAIPLISSERPIVGTGLEKNVATSFVISRT